MDGARGSYGSHRRQPHITHHAVEEHAMSSTITRREFVETAAGLVIAFHLPSGIAERTFRPAAAPSFSPNAWLSIGTDGVVTLTVDKSEMGQGSQTGLAMILAEDHGEADWS